MSHNDSRTELQPSGADLALTSVDSIEPGAPARVPYPVALVRAVIGAWDDNLTDWAAALTYYTVLALFPVMLVVISVFGLSEPGATPEVIEHISAAVPARDLRDLPQQ